jgi:hypothetical protein
MWIKIFTHTHRYIVFCSRGHSLHIQHCETSNLTNCVTVAMKTFKNHNFSCKDYTCQRKCVYDVLVCAMFQNTCVTWAIWGSSYHCASSSTVLAFMWHSGCRTSFGTTAIPFEMILCSTCFVFCLESLYYIIIRLTTLFPE